MGVEPGILPSRVVKVVTIVGGDLEPADGVTYGDLLIRHMWGEIAYQLGGEEGYRLVQNAEDQGIAPGPHFLDELVGDDPVLFLIDEPAEYMRRLGSSAGQLPAFLKTLSDVGDRSRPVPGALVLTLAWNPESVEGQSDAFSQETAELVTSLDQTFREIQSVVSRPARVVTPSERHDIEPILRQRLFYSVDMTAAAPTAEAYLAAFA